VDLEEKSSMDPRRLLDEFMGGQADATRSGRSGTGTSPAGLQNIGGIAGGLAAGGLLGLLMGNKKARKTMGKVAGGAVGLGGAAALGALAYKAYRNWQGNRVPASASSTGSSRTNPAGASALPFDAAIATEESFHPGAAPASDGKPFEFALVKAMIAAANADGHIDAVEQRAIFEGVGRMPLDAGDKAMIFDTLSNPPSVDVIAGLARGPEQAAELYLASRLAIDPDLPEEQAYLSALARKLSLPGALVAELNNQVVQSDPAPSNAA
jgi:uncharacterized membrane protein YebE (DUF533 family)